jgi:hemolysin activation/secretion protein
LSNELLLSLEQIAVGGRYSVRGYRENQLVRNNAVIASLEWRIPIVKEKSWADVVQLAPFVDYGRAWNTPMETPYPDDLTSVGIGLRWERRLKPPATLHPQFEIYFFDTCFQFVWRACLFCLFARSLMLPASTQMAVWGLPQP